MFIAALFTIAKMWKKPTCSSADKWIKNVYVHIYTMEYYQPLPFAATRIDLEGIMLGEIKSCRERQALY